MLHKKRIYIFVVAVISIIIVFHPGRHAIRNYDHIKLDDILDELVILNGLNNKTNLQICSKSIYRSIINNNEGIDVAKVREIADFRQPLNGGEYIPRNCTPVFQTAIVVPYRNRVDQLKIFLNYMHSFLQKQFIHYRIFIVNQNDDLPFNRAKMLNIGAKEAIELNYPCLVLHDVDLLPLNVGNLYACSRLPRHMSSSLDSFRFNLPYVTLSGGAFSIKSGDFIKINGMSNEFEGWGGEDDEFYLRLKSHKLKPIRFSPEISQYTMLIHKKAVPSKVRYAKLSDWSTREGNDGLNSIPKNYVVKLEPLYTHIIV